MAGEVAARLRDLGLVVPAAQPAIASYVPYVRSGNLLTVSGQLPMVEGQPGWRGKLGQSVSLEQGQDAARQCFLNIVAHVSAFCAGDLDRVSRIVRLGGFIACGADFTQHALVMNGASDLAVAVFGDAGRHARATVGVPSLPLDAPVEVEALIELHG